jgi:hypothetical protein
MPTCTAGSWYHPTTRAPTSVCCSGTRTGALRARRMVRAAVSCRVTLLFMAEDRGLARNLRGRPLEGQPAYVNVNEVAAQSDFRLTGRRGRCVVIRIAEGQAPAELRFVGFVEEG